MRNYQIITVFHIYEGDVRVSGGGFNVKNEPLFFNFQCSHGGHFQFESSYSGNECLLKIAYIKNGDEICNIELNVPINRTKKKLKETMLGDNYRLLYRCCFEEVA